VKDAYAAALAAGSAGPVLHRVFQKTFQAAKAVRSSTAITAGQVSVANVAVELALTIFGDLAEARVLLLGAGEIGEKTARAFLSRGAGTLTVSSRTLGRAMELATVLDATALPFEHFAAHLADYDVVVCSTAAPHAILTAEELAPAMRRRPARPLFCIDLAMPRDIDPAVAKLQNVFLYNLDDLGRIAARNLAARTAELAKARAIAQERAAALWRQISERCPGGDPA
jgi:glutamyl-tRNA reductase